MSMMAFPASPISHDHGSVLGDLASISTKASAQAQRAAIARKNSGRRRLVDPATCDRDYTDAQWEFIQAMQDYKRASGRMFPTWSEVLEVLQGLGYQKTEPEHLAD